MTETLQPPQEPHHHPLAMATVALISFILVLVMLAQMGLLAGVGWLNSGPGQRFMQAKANAALAPGGLHLSFGHIQFLTATTIGIDHLEIGDARGALVDAAHVRLGTDLRAIAAGILPLSLAAESVSVHRLPQPATPRNQVKTGALLPPFQLPHLFIHEARLRALAIKTLTLDQGVAGPALTLSPDLEGQASVAGNILTFRLSGGLAAANSPPFVPRTIVLKGQLTANRSLLDLEEVSAKAAAYSVSAKGSADLGQAGPLALSANIDSSDLAALDQGKAPGTAALVLRIGGTADAPALDANGTVSLSAYKAKGLGDIILGLHVANAAKAPRGTLSVSTVYQKHAAALAGNFSFTAPVLTVTNLTLSAPDASAAGQATLDTRTMLADGSLTAAAKLDAYKDLIGVDIAGAVRASVALKADGGRQTAGLNASVSGLRYQTVTVREASLTTALNDLRHPLPDQASLMVADAQVPGVALSRLSATVAKAGDGYSLKLDGAGHYRKDFTLAGSAELKGTGAADASADKIDLRLGSDKGTVTVTGSVLPGRIDLALAASRLPLAALPVPLPDALAGMSVSGKGRLAGPLNDPQGDVALSFSPLQWQKGTPFVALSLTAGYANGHAQAALHGTGRSLQLLEASGAVPLTLSLKPFVFKMPATTPLSGRLAARMNIAALQALMPPGILMAGQVEANASVGGTLAKPGVSGNASLAGGNFIDQALGVALQSIAVRTSMKNDVISVDTLRATDGRSGTVMGSGSLSLGKGNATEVDIHVLHLSPFRNSALAQGTISADIALKGKGAAYVVDGSVRPDRMNITIPSKFNSGIPQLNIVDPHADTRAPQALRTVTLAMTIHAPNRIFVRGWGLDAEFGSADDMTIGGTLADPQIHGTLASIQGRYEQFNKRFDLTRANIRFEGSIPPSPFLDIEAQTVADEVTGIIDITGTAKDPKIALSSNPALPQDEVLSHILFGKDMTNISPFQAIQLAGTLQQLTGHGGGGPGLMDTVRGRLGLDDLEVNNDDTGATTVGAGKYITDKVYLQVDAGSAKTSGDANVKYELTPHLSVNSKISEDAQAGGGVTWSWDY